MNICQYEFQFQNEFMNEIETKIGRILGVEINREKKCIIEREDHSFILRKRDSNNFMLFSAKKNNCNYLMIVRCEKMYEEEIKTVLYEVCDEIEDDYDENHRKEVIDVFGKESNRFIKLEKKYNISKLFEI